MARVIGTPGESAAARGALLLVVVIGSLVLFIGIPSVYALIYSGDRWGFAGLVIMLIGIAAGLYWQRDTWPEAADLIREGANYIRGARGELLVHQELKRLPDECIVFHDFHPVDPASGKPARWNVDHIVIGPSGVFVLDAKYYGHRLVQSAERNQYSRRNVKQAQRNATELRDRLVKWSGGQLERLFVVAVVVYVQPGAQLERLREGATRTLPLRLLRHEILSHSEVAIDQERAGRIARALYSQLGSDIQYAFKAEADAYGELAKAARYAARDARLAGLEASAGSTSVEPAIPTVCPQCGGKLVRRVAGKGPRAGQAFLGCDNFRTTGCKYGFNLEE